MKKKYRNRPDTINTRNNVLAFIGSMTKGNKYSHMQEISMRFTETKRSIKMHKFLPSMIKKVKKKETFYVTNIVKKFQF